MVTRTDIDQIETELMELRTLLMTAREKVRPRLDTLVDRTEQLRKENPTSPFEPTLANVDELLKAFRRGFEVTDKMRNIQNATSGLKKAG